MRLLIVFFTICFCCSCSKKVDDKKENTIGSSLLKNEREVDTLLTSESYSLEAIKIVEEHKINLQSLLPQIILAEVEIYKKTLAQIEKTPLLSYNIEETNLLIELERNVAGESLLNKEIELNQVYFQLFNELSLLNEKYKNILTDKEFIDFYDAGPIVLAEEVMLKVDELVKDEKERIKVKKQKDKNELIINFVTVIPAASTCKGILNSITQAAKYYKKGIDLPLKSGFLAKNVKKIMNDKVANYISKTFKNDQIRTKFSNIGYVPIAVKTIYAGVKNESSYLPPNQAGIMFKVLENKINGRIGDFSDGILAVHLQKVRDIIKSNQAVITVCQNKKEILSGGL